MPNDYVKKITQLVREEYDANLEAWQRNERRFNAGEDVYEELRAFQWEAQQSPADAQTSEGTQTTSGFSTYESRKDAAICVEFASMTKEKFGGLVFQHFPSTDGGGLDLGNLNEGDAWRAEAIKHNADGAGKNARSLEAFWRDEMELSLATRYRWILAEAPEGGAANAEEEERKRPYFVGFSPTQVPYWFERDGDLQCVRIEIEVSEPRIVDGEVKHETSLQHYIMTRAGFTGWGTAEDAGDPRFAFNEGGWWIVDEEGDLIMADDAGNVVEGESEGTPLMGTWELTGGEIPMAPLYYERGKPGNTDTGITHIGRLQTEFMNQLSAMFYSSWVGGSGVVFFTGADDEQWETIRDAGILGGRWVPIPPKVSETGQTANVEVTALAAFDASPAIVKSLDWLLRLATQLILRELTTSPDASGVSRQMEFVKGNSPRLSNIAANLEECMTTMHRYLEMRWGFAEPGSNVTWTRAFDLRTALEKIREVLDMLAISGSKSPALITDLIMQAIRSEGLFPEGEEGDKRAEEIRAQLEASITTGVQETDMLNQMMSGGA